MRDIFPVTLLDHRASNAKIDRYFWYFYHFTYHVQLHDIEQSKAKEVTEGDD